MSSCRRTAMRGRASKRCSTRSCTRRGQTILGWRDVPVENGSLSKAPEIVATEPVHRQAFIARSASIASDDDFERKAVHHSQGRLQPRLCGVARRGYRLLRLLDVGAHRRLQGDVPRLPARRLLQGPLRSALRKRALPRPPAFLDQHVSVLEAGTPVPDGRPQRRDQHVARQRQLDGGASGVGRFGTLRQRHLQALADLLRGSVGHGVLRQRAGIPARGRLPARPRDDDADPGGLVRQQADVARDAGLLRVSRGADGAVGRAGGRRLHRRAADRRDPRSQTAFARRVTS